MVRVFNYHPNWGISKTAHAKYECSCRANIPTIYVVSEDTLTPEPGPSQHKFCFTSSSYHEDTAGFNAT